MSKHLAIKVLCPKLLGRYLQLFKQTTQELDNPSLHQNKNMLAYRIANRLWTRYQIQNYPDKALQGLREV